MFNILKILKENIQMQSVSFFNKVSEDESLFNLMKECNNLSDIHIIANTYGYNIGSSITYTDIIEFLDTIEGLEFSTSTQLTDIELMQVAILENDDLLSIDTSWHTCDSNRNGCSSS